MLCCRSLVLWPNLKLSDPRMLHSTRDMIWYDRSREGMRRQPVRVWRESRRLSYRISAWHSKKITNTRLRCRTKPEKGIPGRSRFKTVFIAKLIIGINLSTLSPLYRSPPSRPQTKDGASMLLPCNFSRDNNFWGCISGKP